MKKNNLYSPKSLLGKDRLISESEATELINAVKGERNVTLDFAGIEEIGEAFAKELFIVWYHNNPDVMLSVIRANERVEETISQVIRAK